MSRPRAGLPLRRAFLLLTVFALVPVAAASQLRTSPDALRLAQDLHRQGRPAAFAARALMTELRQTDAAAVAAVAQAGWAGDEVTAVAIGDLRMAPAAAAAALRAGSVPVTSILDGMRRSGTDTRQALDALSRAGFAAAELVPTAARALATPSEAFTFLQARGFASTELSRVFESEGMAVDLGCIRPDGQPTPCGDFGGAGGEPVMGQLQWTPRGEGMTDSILRIEGSNIPDVEVRIGASSLQVLGRSASWVQARLPSSPVTGTLTLKRVSDGVSGVLEEGYVVRAPTTQELSAALDWAAFAAAARTATYGELNRWLAGASVQPGRCIIQAVAAVTMPGWVGSTYSFGSDIRTALQQAGAPGQVAQGWEFAVHQAWRTWADGLSVTGLPLWPLFADPNYAGGPLAGLPVPLITIPSAGVSAMGVEGLKQRIAGAVGAWAEPQVADDAITAFSGQLFSRFIGFVNTGTLVNLMGVPPGPAAAGQKAGAPAPGVCTGAGILVPPAHFF